MTNKTWSRKLVAIPVAVAILSVSSTLTRARPGRRGAELSVFGEITLNGQKAISGVTLFSESDIITAPGSSASVSLGKLGRIELAANTKLRLCFADNSISGLLAAGRARFSTAADVSLDLTTPDGSVLVDGSQATSLVVNAADGNTSVSTETGQAELCSHNVTTTIAVGEIGATRSTQGTRKDDNDNKPHGGSFWAAWLATGSVIAAAIWVVTHEKQAHENDLDFGGTVIVPSG